MPRIQLPRTAVARKYRQSDVAAAVFPRPALGESKQRAADAFAVVTGSDDEVGDMAVHRAGEEVLMRLQVQESEPLCVFAFRHVKVRRGWQFPQMTRDVGTDSSERFGTLASGRQIEIDQPIGDREDEFVVVGVGQADMRSGSGNGLGHDGAAMLGCVYPNRASGMPIRLSIPARSVAACVCARGRMRAK